MSADMDVELERLIEFLQKTSRSLRDKQYEADRRIPGALQCMHDAQQRGDFEAAASHFESALQRKFQKERTIKHIKCFVRSMQEYREYLTQQLKVLDP